MIIGKTERMGVVRRKRRGSLALNARGAAEATHFACGLSPSAPSSTARLRSPSHPKFCRMKPGGTLWGCPHLAAGSFRAAEEARACGRLWPGSFASASFVLPCHSLRSEEEEEEGWGPDSSPLFPFALPARGEKRSGGGGAGMRRWARGVPGRTKGAPGGKGKEEKRRREGKGEERSPPRFT